MKLEAPLYFPALAGDAVLVLVLAAAMIVGMAPIALPNLMPS
jgi:hypothetical protein